MIKLVLFISAWIIVAISNNILLFNIVLFIVTPALLLSSVWSLMGPVRLRSVPKYLISWGDLHHSLLKVKFGGIDNSVYTTPSKDTLRGVFGPSFPSFIKLKYITLSDLEIDDNSAPIETVIQRLQEKDLYLVCPNWVPATLRIRLGYKWNQKTVHCITKKGVFCLSSGYVDGRLIGDISNTDYATLAKSDTVYQGDLIVCA